MRYSIIRSVAGPSCRVHGASGALAVVVAAVIGAACPGIAGAATYQTVYFFAGPPQDGSEPVSTLAVDAQGLLYGTTYIGGPYGVGTAFRLTPPATPGALWTEEVLASFGLNLALGANPATGVTLGSDGSVYGTTEGGGSATGRGLVFKLTDAVGWPETVLHIFTGGQGGVPDSTLLFGPDGLLYGSTRSFDYNGSQSGGISYSVSPLGDSAGFTDLYRFGGGGTPYGPSNLVLASAGGRTVYLGADQFGGPAKQGGVFSLTVTPGRPAKEQLIYQFAQGADVGQPSDGPVVGRNGLAGAFYGCGTVGGQYGQGGIYEIIPHKGSAATESVIYSFGAHSGDPRAVASPAASARCSLMQGKGTNTLYGVTGAGGSEGGGAFFEIDPPASGQTVWTEKVDFDFTGGGIDDPEVAEPQAAPVEIGGHFYGTALAGGHNNYGGVYEVTP